MCVYIYRERESHGVLYVIERYTFMAHGIDTYIGRLVYWGQRVVCVYITSVPRRTTDQPSNVNSKLVFVERHGGDTSEWCKELLVAPNGSAPNRSEIRWM